MSPASVLVTGAERGIGLGLVNAFLTNENIKNIIATCMEPESALELKAIVDDRLSLIKMDVTNDKSIEDAVIQVDKIVGKAGLNLLVNNAGILLSYSTHDKPNRELVRKQLEVNTISVVIVTQYFLPLLQRAAAQNNADEFSVDHAAIVNISSDLASITNSIGSRNPMVDKVFPAPIGFLPYRMSKTALNSMAKCMAVDLTSEKILVANFHPGWVRTDMGGPHAPVTVEDSTKSLVSSIYALKKEHTGGYFERDGKPIPL